MSEQTIQLDYAGLLEWSKEREVRTARGPRLLQTAAPTDEFWEAWRQNNDAMRQAGISVKRNPKGDWEVCWWKALPEAVIEQRKASLEASQAKDAVIDVAAPEGLKYLPYQRAGIAWSSSRQNSLIADEMGLGKTIQAIGAINADPSIQRVMVICPASLKLNWRRELRRWLIRPLSVGIVDKTWPCADIVITNYDVLKRDHDACRLITWDLLIIDEAHLTKNPDAQRTQQVWGKQDRGGDWKITPIPAKRRIALTGTPIVNRPIEAWPIVHGLAPEVFPNFWSYARRYCDAHRNGFGWDFTGASHLDELQEKLRTSIMIRRLKADVLTELPPKRRQVIELPANGAVSAVEAEQRAYARHEQLLEQLRAAAELSKASENPADYSAAVQRLREAAAVAFEEVAQTRHEVALAKVPYVVEHIREAIESSGKVLCFAHHRDVVAAIAKEFGGACVTVTGDTPITQRQDHVDRFQRDPDCTLFIGNIQAAGVGLTLTASSHVVFAELDWVPGNVTQAEDRAHRIGQRESVLVQHLVLEGSLDARIAKALVKKQAVIDAALDKPIEIVNEPILPFGRHGTEQAGTEEAQPDKIGELAARMSIEATLAVHLGLRMLAGMCDGAHAKDDSGFNRIDTLTGHQLAAQPTLSPRQAALGAYLVRKYRRQLPEHVVGPVQQLLEGK